MLALIFPNYYPLPLACLRYYIPCPFRVVADKFWLVVLHLPVRVSSSLLLQ